MPLQEIEVRYTVELTHKLQVPEGKTPTEVVREFFQSIYAGAPAQGTTHPQSAQLRFAFDENGERVYLSIMPEEDSATHPGMQEMADRR